MALKNITEAKSSSKSWTLLCFNYLWRMLMMLSLAADLISSAKFMMCSLMLRISSMSLPRLWIFSEYRSMICWQTISILWLERFVISSIKSLMANLALSDRIFWMCLLLSNYRFFTVERILFSLVPPTNILFLLSFPACLKIKILFLWIKNSRNFLSSSSKRKPF